MFKMACFSISFDMWFFFSSFGLLCFFGSLILWFLYGSFSLFLCFFASLFLYFLVFSVVFCFLCAFCFVGFFGLTINPIPGLQQAGSTKCGGAGLTVPRGGQEPQPVAGDPQGCSSKHLNAVTSLICLFCLNRNRKISWYFVVIQINI